MTHRSALPAFAPLLLAVVVVAAVADRGHPARAAFPGANGRIAFTHEAPAGDHTQSDIYTVKPDGSGVRRLTATADRNEFGPAWSPAGDRIAYWRTKAPFGIGSIWVMDARGGHKRQLTQGIDARDPAWDPTGTRIVFTGPSQGGFFDLWTMRASDGGGRRRLTSGVALDFEPAWSPDGKWVAFTRGFEQGDAGDVYVIELATKKVTRITRSPAYDHQVGWSPDGRQVVFERDGVQASSTFVVNVNGSGLKRLSAGRFFDVGPAFSPDGTLIAFGSDRGGATLGDLWVMNADGSNKRRFLAMEFGEGFPDWQAVGD